MMMMVDAFRRFLGHPGRSQQSFLFENTWKTLNSQLSSPAQRLLKYILIFIKIGKLNLLL
jgi:hypothetical protein